MLLLLTIGLVLVGAVSLVIGFVSQNTLPIYISIACSVAAGLVLLVFSRMNRRQAVVPVGTAVSDAAGGPATTEFVLEEARAAARPSAAAAAADDGFPIEDYDQLLVSEIVPLLPELDLEELDAVRAREEDGKSRASILRRIDALAEELEGTGGPVATDDDDEVEDDFVDEVEVEVAVDDDEDELFPIADYDDLRVNQILPLLPELDDDELAMVAARERAGADRYSILVRVDELLGVTVAPAKRPAPSKKAPAKKAPAKKTAAKKAPAKAAAKKAAPVKKAAAKKSAAKKAAPRRAGGAQKTQKAAAKKR